MKKLNFSLALLAMVLLAACGQQDSSTDAVDAAPDERRSIRGRIAAEIAEVQAAGEVDRAVHCGAV